MSDIGRLVQEAPFTDRHAAGAAKLYVTFLSKPPRRAHFPNAFVEQALGVSATSRNWSTVKKIAALGAKTR